MGGSGDVIPGQPALHWTDGDSIGVDPSASTFVINWIEASGEIGVALVYSLRPLGNSAVVPGLGDTVQATSAPTWPALVTENR